MAPPSGKTQDKLRVEENRRNDTPKDGNCFFHAVCGSLRDLLAKGVIDKALIDISKEKGHVACRAEAVRALGEFRKTSPKIVKDWPKYIAGMSHAANGSGDREAWGGTVETQALAHFGNLATKEGKPVRFMFREWSRLHLDPGYVDIGDAKGAVMIELINNNNGHWEWLTPKVGSQADDEAAKLV